MSGTEKSSPELRGAGGTARCTRRGCRRRRGHHRHTGFQTGRLTAEPARNWPCRSHSGCGGGCLWGIRHPPPIRLAAIHYPLTASAVPRGAVAARRLPLPRQQDLGHEVEVKRVDHRPEDVGLFSLWEHDELGERHAPERGDEPEELPVVHEPGPRALHAHAGVQTPQIMRQSPQFLQGLRRP